MDFDETLKIRIDNRLESYKTFFDHQWANSIGELAQGTRFEKPVLALTLNWKSAANTHALPWIMMDCLNGLWNGFMHDHKPIAVKLISAYRQRILTEMGDSLSNMRKKELASVLDKIGKQVCEAAEQAKPEFDVEGTWSVFLSPESHEFQLALWGSQRICYGSLYHTYENFIRHCVGLSKGDPDYRPHFHKLVDDTCDLLGGQISQYCLTTQQVEIARHVRNTLAHNGGKVTEELLGVPHGVAVEDETLQIMAPHTRKLFNDLNVRAFKFIKAAIALPTSK